MHRIALAVLTLLVGPALLSAQDSEGDERPDENEGLPLPVDRTVPVDLTEGSWMSLDVSPDGQTIVFDYLGDLFTVPISGGTATQLTSGLATMKALALTRLQSPLIWQRNY